MVTKVPRALALTLTVLGLFLLSAAPDCAYACSCMMPGPPQEALEQSSAVFSGRVVSIQAKGAGPVESSLDPVVVMFDAQRFWKGQPHQTMLVETANSSASCGFSFQQGQEYVVYAFGDGTGPLQVSLCSRTNLLAQAGDDITALGEGSAPAPEPTSPPSTMPEPTVTTTSSSSDRLLTLGAIGAAALAVVGGLLFGLKLYRGSRDRSF